MVTVSPREHLPGEDRDDACFTMRVLPASIYVRVSKDDRGKP